MKRKQTKKLIFLREQNSGLIIHTQCMCGLWQIPQDEGRTPLKPKMLQHAVLDLFLCISLMGEFGMYQTVLQLDLNRKTASPQISYPTLKRDPEHKLSWAQTFTHRLPTAGWFLPLPHCQLQAEICRPPQITRWSIRNSKQKWHSENRLIGH